VVAMSLPLHIHGRILLTIFHRNVAIQYCGS
jgi:hypothetical protein